MLINPKEAAILDNVAPAQISSTSTQPLSYTHNSVTSHQYLDIAPTVTKVAIAGISGNVAEVVVKELVSRRQFNVTALVRQQPAKTPAGVTVKVVDFASVDKLAEVLKGQDAVVDTIAAADNVASLNLINAAVAAGVYRIIPSEFSVDPENAKLRAMPVFRNKVEIYEYVEKLGSEGKITWTSVFNNAFLDWGFRSGFLDIFVKNKKARYINGGTLPIKLTNLDAVGNAVVGSLEKPKETKNRLVYVHNAEKSPKELLGLAREVSSADGWDVADLNGPELFAASIAKLQSGQVDFQLTGDLILYSISTPELAAPAPTDDNELLGVKVLSDDELKQLIKDVVAEKA